MGEKKENKRQIKLHSFRYKAIKFIYYAYFCLLVLLVLCSHNFIIFILFFIDLVLNFNNYLIKVIKKQTKEK